MVSPAFSRGTRQKIERTPNTKAMHLIYRIHITLLNFAQQTFIQGYHQKFPLSIEVPLLPISTIPIFIQLYVHICNPSLNIRREYFLNRTALKLFFHPSFLIYLSSVNLFHRLIRVVRSLEHGSRGRTSVLHGNTETRRPCGFK